MSAKGIWEWVGVMSSELKPKVYDLETRTIEFASSVRRFVRLLPRNTGNYEDSKQVVRSSGSVGANYIEANESLSSKDRVLRMRIARKEAKETRYWLMLIDTGNAEKLESERKLLIQESTELMNILSAIIRKLTNE